MSNDLPYLLYGRLKIKMAMRGYNIVADWWVGANNSLFSPHTRNHNCVIFNACFHTFQLGCSRGPNRWANELGQLQTQSYEPIFFLVSYQCIPRRGICLIWSLWKGCFDKRLNTLLCYLVNLSIHQSLWSFLGSGLEGVDDLCFHTYGELSPSPPFGQRPRRGR